MQLHRDSTKCNAHIHVQTTLTDHPSAPEDLGRSITSETAKLPHEHALIKSMWSSLVAQPQPLIKVLETAIWLGVRCIRAKTFRSQIVFDIQIKFASAHA